MVCCDDRKIGNWLWLLPGKLRSKPGISFHESENPSRQIKLIIHHHQRESLSAVDGQDLRNILLLFSILQEEELRFFRVPKSTAPFEDKDLRAVTVQWTFFI